MESELTIQGNTGCMIQYINTRHKCWQREPTGYKARRQGRRYSAVPRQRHLLTAAAPANAVHLAGSADEADAAASSLSVAAASAAAVGCSAAGAADRVSECADDSIRRSAHTRVHPILTAFHVSLRLLLKRPVCFMAVAACGACCAGCRSGGTAAAAAGDRWRSRLNYGCQRQLVKLYCHLQMSADAALTALQPSSVLCVQLRLPMLLTKTARRMRCIHFRPFVGPCIAAAEDINQPKNAEKLCRLNI